jgi:hypothetical protein
MGCGNVFHSISAILISHLSLDGYTNRGNPMQSHPDEFLAIRQDGYFGGVAAANFGCSQGFHGQSDFIPYYRTSKRVVGRGVNFFSHGVRLGHSSRLGIGDLRLRAGTTVSQ